MLICNRVTYRVPLLGAALILLAGGCSKEPDRVTTGDTAAATSSASVTPESAAPTRSASADSLPVRVDTTTMARTQSDSVAQTPPPKPRVKPSIDPGRKTTRPTATSPAPTAPTRDSALDRDSASAPLATSTAGQDKSLKYDAGTNTVTFELIGGPNGFQFNGHASGSATLTLPPKANVVINFVNKDGTPHSAEVISGEGPLPNAGVDAAIPRAYTNQLLPGLPQEAGDAMRFQAPERGTYRIFCGVPGHGLSGMWIWMKVDPAAKTPSFAPTKS
jgi:plastocyanin